MIIKNIYFQIKNKCTNNFYWKINSYTNYLFKKKIKLNTVIII